MNSSVGGESTFEIVIDDTGAMSPIRKCDQRSFNWIDETVPDTRPFSTCIIQGIQAQEENLITPSDTRKFLTVPHESFLLKLSDAYEKLKAARLSAKQKGNWRLYHQEARELYAHNTIKSDHKNAKSILYCNAGNSIYDNMPVKFIFVCVDENPIQKLSADIHEISASHIEDKLNIWAFLDEVQTYQKLNKIDTALDVIYSYIEGLLVDKKLSIVEEILSIVEMSQWNEDLQLGLLVVTKPWKTKIPKREQFFKWVESNFLASRTPTDVGHILKGLM